MPVGMNQVKVEENYQPGAPAHQENGQANSGNLIACKLYNISSTLPEEAAEAAAYSSPVSVETCLKKERRLLKNR
ncbi:hypothetical protein EYF80_014591 [Liparis tanakae]|uniref:Uncharacterized protein n=1 Tax=Liparis tanakae TaxID=230148 RepID=A0A4Z2IBU3_9TELE|nr:hypothetical protein EYF80_014591 [Liparis tanakae]